MIFRLAVASGIRQDIVLFDSEESVVDFYKRAALYGYGDMIIDDVFCSQASEINWIEVIAPCGVLLQGVLDLLNSDDPLIAHKIQFLHNEGFDIPIEDISLSIRAVDTMSPSPMDIVHCNYGHKYPETFIDECVQQTPQWKQLLRQLEACHCESYFGDGFARMLSDQECNGVLTSGFIGDVFLVKWNKEISV